MKERGGNPLEAARVLNNLGGLSHDLRQYAQAEAYYPQALLIWTPMFGAEHPDVLSVMNNLAGVYLEQGKGAEAEPLYKWVLQERQRLFGPNHPHVAQSLNNLGCLSRRSLCSRSRSACVGNT